MSLEKILRLAGEDKAEESSSPGEDIRMLVKAAHAALTEACATDNPATAAELVQAAVGVVESLAAELYTDAMEDWVEATAVPIEGSLSLAGAATAPYGDVPYADPGYLGGKKRYPIDEKHVRAAWSYINQAKNAARYTAAQLSAIKGKIKAAMKKHGHGVNVDASATDPVTAPVLLQLSSGEAYVVLAAAPTGDIPMQHAPFTGSHAHAHAVSMVHGHDHSHMGDNMHSGQMHGANAGQKAWAAKGESGWAAHRQNWAHDRASER